MARVRLHKVVASLPAVLQANCLYLVRAGSGFDQYVTNGSGTIVAYPMNRPAYSGGGSMLVVRSGGQAEQIPISAGAMALIRYTGAGSSIPISGG